MQDIVETAADVREGRRSARACVDDALERVEAHNEALGAFIAVDEKLARGEAERIDAAVARGEDPGPLAGVPFGVKDADACAGLPLSHGSQLEKGRPVERRDSVHIGRLRAAGAIPIGVTAAPEFGALSWTRSKAWGVARNPWARGRTPGGSSGGSASAVAAALVPFATAGDGGGSTRIPAGYTGLVGLKPSFGRIPREGATTSQTAVWGALTTTVRDAARHLDVAAGPDDRDRTTLPAVDYSYEELIETRDVAGLRCMWSEDLGFAAVDPEVRSLCAAAAQQLIEAAALSPRDVPLELDDLFRAWSNAGAIDIWLHMQRGDWPDRATELGGNIRRSLEATQSIPLPWYAKVLRSRTALEARVAEIFEEVDVLLTPTTAVPAHAAEGPPPAEIDGRPVEPAMAVPFTMLANLCWNPAISVPAGQTADGLPVGLQIMTRRHADDVALRLARIAEQHFPGLATHPAIEVAWIRERPVGLVYRDIDQTTPGYTLYCPVRGHTANLIDADGRIVHRWRHPEGIQHAHLIDGGHLFVQTQPHADAEGTEQIGGSAAAILELDWDSNVVWEYRDRFMHHDYQRLADGRVVLLRWERLPQEVHDQVRGAFSAPEDPERMWGDVVHEISAEGKLLHEWRSWEHLSFEEDVMCPLESRKEWTHANSLDVLPDGNWLISFRLTSTVAVVDRATGDFVWKYRPGFISHQHAATGLDNGNVLIFDNGCHRRAMPSFSQVIEVDPAKSEVVWSYTAPVVLSFYSFMVSGASRLANGNTFITEGASGRIFEVTPEKETVWEYVTPFQAIDPRFGPTPALFRAHRYEADDPRLAGRDLEPGRHADLEARIADGGLAVGEE